MIKNNDLISIIIPVYNVDKYIDETIKSILNQDYTNWELICVDDCSSDNSLDILRKYEKNNPRIRVFENEVNCGPSKTRNKGLFHARGNYITFLDSDDYWYKDKLSKQYTFMKENNYYFTFTGYDLADEKGRPLNKIVQVPERINYEELLQNTVISTITVMIDSRFKDQLIMPENISNGEDMAAWLNLLKTIDYAYGLNQILSTYRQVNNSLSSGIKNKLTRMWYVYRKVEKLSLFYSIRLYIKYIINVLRKRKKVGYKCE